MEAERLRAQLVGLTAAIAEAEEAYQAAKQNLEPLIGDLTSEADALAVEFKQLVQEAANAYAQGAKELASTLAQERRAKQEKCEALNSQVNEYRVQLRSLRDVLINLKRRHKDLTTELRTLRKREQARKEAAKRVPLYNMKRCPIRPGVIWGTLKLFPIRVIEWVESIGYYERDAGPKHLGATLVRDDSEQPLPISLYPPTPKMERILTDNGIVLLYSRVLIHEMAHVAYFRVLSEHGRAAWQDINSWSDAESYVSSYARKNEEEDFSESFIAYVATPERLKDLSPERYNFIDGLVHKLEAEEMADDTK